MGVSGRTDKNIKSTNNSCSGFLLLVCNNILSQQTFVGLQHVFSVTILRLPRRLEDVLEDEKLLR